LCDITGDGKQSAKLTLHDIIISVDIVVAVAKIIGAKIYRTKGKEIPSYVDLAVLAKCHNVGEHKLH